MIVRDALAGLSAYDGVGCRGVEPFIAELDNLLASARAQGLASNAAIVSAQAVYDDLNGYVVYLPFGTDCERHTAEAQATIDRVRAALTASGKSIPDPIRPDAKPADPYGIPGWMKFVAVGGIVVIGLSYVSPLLSLIPRRKRA